jgi:hypothetical protein
MPLLRATESFQLADVIMRDFGLGIVLGFSLGVLVAICITLVVIAT